MSAYPVSPSRLVKPPIRPILPHRLRPFWAQSIMQDVAWVPFWEKDDDVWLYSARYGRYELTRGSGGSWGTDIWGADYNSKGSDSGLSLTAPDWMRHPKFCVVMWAGILNSDGFNNNNTRLVGIDYNSADTTPFVACSLNRNSGPEADLRLSWNEGAGAGAHNANFVGATPTSEYGELHTYIGAVDLFDGRATLLKDGVEFGVDTSPVAGTSIAYDSTAPFRINGAQNTANHPDADTAIVGMYVGGYLDRGQLARLAFEFHRDPYGGVRWARRRSGLLVPTGATLEGYRFRNDDGSEAAATWAQAQDVDHTVDVDEEFRLRMVVDEPVTGPYTLEVAPDGTEDWFEPHE